MAGGWRYVAVQLHGDGTNTLVHPDLPLQDVKITDVLSGPGRLTGTLAYDLQWLKGPRGRPVLLPWSTEILAVVDGQIRGGGILLEPEREGGSLTIDCVGFSGYAAHQPFLDSYFNVQVDPLDEARHIWAYLQSLPRGDLGVTLDGTKSPVLIGTELDQVEFDTQAGPVSFEAGPYKLAWYVTDDLGKEFDDLASSTPFDYHEEYGWADDGSVTHHIALGYPTIGVRRPELRFVLNENISVIPKVTFDGDDYANGVVVLGAGEGRDMVQSPLIDTDDGRLRRVTTVADKTITNIADATTRARSELATRALVDGGITEVVVRDHPNAPLGSWVVGDEVRLKIRESWGVVDMWARVIENAYSPEDIDVATLTLLRTDQTP